MRNFYYATWADAINRFKTYNPQRKDWKITLFLFMTWINALNLWIILLWLKYFKILTIPLLHFDILPVKSLNQFINFTIEFALPFGIINYFFIFYHERHLRIVEKHSYPNSNLALPYTLIIILGALLSGVLYGILTTQN
jgi:hypothetical protein